MKYTKKGRRFLEAAVSKGFGKDEVSRLATGFARRLSELRLRCHKYGVAYPDEMALWDWVCEQYVGGFRCGECRQVMEFRGTDNPRIWTLEHQTPLSFGGDNSIRNFALLCFECNIKRWRNRGQVYTDKSNSSEVLRLRKIREKKKDLPVHILDVQSLPFHLFRTRKKP